MKPEALFAYGTFENVRLSQGELAKLYERFGPEDARARIEELSEYIAAKGKKYKSHFATLLMWARMDAKRNGNAKPATKDLRNAETAKRLLSRMDSEDRSRSECGDRRSDAVGLFGKTSETDEGANGSGRREND